MKGKPRVQEHQGQFKLCQRKMKKTGLATAPQIQIWHEKFVAFIEAFKARIIQPNEGINKMHEWTKTKTREHEGNE